MKRKLHALEINEIKKKLADSIHQQIMELDFDELNEVYIEEQNVIMFKIIPTSLGYAVQKAYVDENLCTNKGYGSDLEEKLGELLSTIDLSGSSNFDA